MSIDPLGRRVEPGFVYRAMQSVLRGLLGAFFREVEVSGVEHVPRDRGGVLISWHPNGLVDPALILTRFSEPVVFGARNGLFRWPVVGSILRALGTVPIHRATDAAGGDEASRRGANRRSLELLASRVGAGAFSALFPEGLSHDDPHLARLKSGAARLYYRARVLRPAGTPPPAIVPVGLHYDRKLGFRSRALVWFHPPIELSADLDHDPDPREAESIALDRARRLTYEFERVLRDVVHATESWEVHRILHRGRRLIRAERARRTRETPGEPNVEELAVGFARIRAAYYSRLETHPHEVASIRREVERYDRDLRALGLDDHDLDRNPSLNTISLAGILLSQLVLVFLFLPPVLLLGYVVNGPALLLVMAAARYAAPLKKDVATVKILAGGVAFPLSWILAGVLGAAAHSQLREWFPAFSGSASWVGGVIALLSALGGMVALRYVRLARDTVRAVQVRLTRVRSKRSLARLRRERRKIYDRMLDLPRTAEMPAPDESIRP